MTRVGDPLSVPREALPDELACFRPRTGFCFGGRLVLSQPSEKPDGGAAPGPSGMTADHLRPLLDVSDDSLVLGQVAALFSRAQVPTEIFYALGAGRLTGHARIWPNRIWPELVFQSVDRIWPNRIWPILVF